MEKKEKWYIVLGVNPDASDEEIKEKYLNLVKKYHPDANIGKSEGEIKAAAEKLKEVNVAFEKSKNRTNSDIYNTKTQTYDEIMQGFLEMLLKSTRDNVIKELRKYNQNISDIKLSNIINNILTLTLISYDKENFGKEWSRFIAFKSPNNIDEIYVDLLNISRYIEEMIPVYFRNGAYKQYITDILSILIMSKEEELINFPKVL